MDWQGRPTPEGDLTDLTPEEEALLILFEKKIAAMPPERAGLVIRGILEANAREEIEHG